MKALFPKASIIYMQSLNSIAILHYMK